MTKAETQFQNAIIELAQCCGVGSIIILTIAAARVPGWPDLVLVRDRDRIIFAELKKPKGGKADRGATGLVRQPF